MSTQLIETIDGLSLLPSNIQLPQPAGTDRIILIPYADALALVNAKGTTKLAVGLMYRITNRVLQGAGTMGDVLVEAIGEYEFAPNGLLFANVPDYSNIDSWSVLNSQTRAWSAGVEVAHLGKTWVLQFGASGTQVPGAGNQWVIKIGLTTDGNGNSVPETDEVIYRLDYDWISERKDKRGNSVVSSYNGDQIYIRAGYPLCIDQFAWGSPNAYSNEIFDCDFGDLLLTNVQNNHVTGNRISSSIFNATFFVDNTLVIIDSTIDRAYFEVSSIGTIEKSEIVGSFVRYNDYMYIKNCSFLDTQVIGFSGTQSNYHTVLDGIIATKAILTSIAPAAQLIVLQNCIISGYKQFAFNEQINGKIIGYGLDGSAVAINEANLVHKTGDEIIAGLKTLSNKLQVNAPIAAAGIVESTMGGMKFPDGTIQITAAVSGTVINEANLVHKTGDETIAGLKTLSNKLQVNAPIAAAGIIETTTGGVKFPDGTIQITAAATGGGIYKVGTGTSSVVTIDNTVLNTASGFSSLVLGGYNNVSSTNYTTVLNGTGNSATAYGASILGGINNTATQPFATVINGNGNIVTGFKSLAAGNSNMVSSENCVVLGGDGNLISGASVAKSAVFNGSFNTINASNCLIASSDNCSIAAGCTNTTLIGCTNLVITTGINQTYINNVKVVSGSGGGGGGTTYTLPAATANALGGVIVPQGYDIGLNIAGNGALGLTRAAPGVLGGIKPGSGLAVDTAGVLSIAARATYITLIPYQYNPIVTSQSTPMLLTGSNFQWIDNLRGDRTAYFDFVYSASSSSASVTVYLFDRYGSQVFSHTSLTGLGLSGILSERSSPITGLVNGQQYVIGISSSAGTAQFYSVFMLFA